MHESVVSMPQPADRRLAESPTLIYTFSAPPFTSLRELPLMSMSRPVADEAAMNLMQVNLGVPNGWHKRP